MESCREFEELIDRAHAGEAGAVERERLAAHLESCSSCDELFDLLGQLAGEAASDEPSEHQLARMRRGVHAGLHASRRDGWRPGRRWVWAALLSGAAFAAGLVVGGGRGMPSDAPAEPVRGLANAPELAGEMRRVAARHAQLADVADSPFTYADVQVRQLEGGRVRLAFDVSRHLDLELDRRDPLVADVLVQAMTASSSVGTRIEAIDFAGNELEPRVKQALLVAMRRDPNLGVRLEAQARLAALPHDDEIERGMLDVLAEDAEVQMRLGAVDYLARVRVAPDRLEHALARSDRNDNPAVRVRAARYLASENPN